MRMGSTKNSIERHYVIRCEEKYLGGLNLRLVVGAKASNILKEAYYYAEKESRP